MLEKERAAIDALDERLMALLEERFAVVREIGEVKRARGLPVFDAAREAAVLERCPSEAVRKVYAAVFAAARELEER